MGRFVIVAYKANFGQSEKLLSLVRNHLDILKQENLVTDREAYVMQASDGVFVEVFEWQSQEAIARAHENNAVNAMWSEFAEVCEFVPLNTLPESAEMFAEFDSLPG